MSSPNINIYRKWLLLAILSLLLAGLLTFIIVFSRTPIIKEVFFFKDFFARALISHVNLSQLFWTFTMGLVITIMCLKKYLFYFQTFFYIAFFSILLVFVSPFLGSGAAILNNYIPIINNLPFVAAISLFMTIIFLCSCYYIIFCKSFFSNDNIKSLLYTYHLIVVIAFINYLGSIRLVSNLNISIEYYEIMFWSFGHIIQFAYVVLMVMAWLIILKSTNCRMIFSNNFLQVISFFYITIATISLVAYGSSKSSIYQFKEFFTKHMIYGCSFLAIIVGIGLIYSFFDKNLYSKNPKNRVLLNSFIGSFLLFFYGGFLGLKIAGNNTIIPAHYHGQAVGVTIALVGLIYYYLPKLGYGEIKSRLAIWQPVLYAFGQFIHISGLAISGGYGALRKSPDSIYGFNAKFWMGVMGFGGLITLISGIIFFIICYKSIRSKTLN